MDHGDERERTPDDVSKGSLATSKPGAGLLSWDKVGGCPMMAKLGVRHERGRDRDPASIRNVRTCRSDVKGAGQAGSPCKTLSTKAETGAVARSSEEGSVMGLGADGAASSSGMAMVNQLLGGIVVISQWAAWSVRGEESGI